ARRRPGLRPAAGGRGGGDGPAGRPRPRPGHRSTGALVQRAARLRRPLRCPRRAAYPGWSRPAARLRCRHRRPARCHRHHRRGRHRPARRRGPAGRGRAHRTAAGTRRPPPPLRPGSCRGRPTHDPWRVRMTDSTAPTSTSTTGKERVVLAYSGGLDTSVAIGWIGEQTGAEVIAVAVDVGQGGEDLEVIRQRALDCGAVEAYVADAREEFATEYCMPALRANALYQDRYPLVSALSRPVIVKHLVRA